jgi:MFS family permease
MNDRSSPLASAAPVHRTAMRFVLLIGVLSFFADFTYEGARSILGPYLASLQATAFIVGAVTGFGELLGYGLRFFSGRLADVTGRFWPITIFGYVLQMASVPALALTGNWKSAAVLIVLERVGRAIRNPPRDVMLSHAARHLGGYGWTFGIHEACDQFGAMFGPLVVALVLARHGSYHEAFAVLLVPALINLALVVAARLLYPKPQDLESATVGQTGGTSFSRTFWIYLAGAALVALGFADYPLLAYHFARTGTVSNEWIAVFYAVAMAVSGTGSLVFGRLFDRYGFRVLVVLTVIASLFAPLVFLGGFTVALFGAAVWGMGIGVHESIIPAAVTPMVPAQRRASAFGLFTAGYGIFWFLGSAAIGLLYDHSISWTIVFCMTTQLLAIPVFLWVGHRQRVETVAVSPVARGDTPKDR